MEIQDVQMFTDLPAGRSARLPASGGPMAGIQMTAKGGKMFFWLHLVTSVYQYKSVNLVL